MITQPVPAPASIGEFRQLLEAGKLLRLDGSPLVSTTCQHCGDGTLGETCPRSIDCPACEAKAGQICRRPSGHNNFGKGSYHKRRIEAAERIDQQRELLLDPSLPAPWPEASRQEQLL